MSIVMLIELLIMMKEGVPSIVMLIGLLIMMTEGVPQELLSILGIISFFDDPKNNL